jgi:hypothetical protein
VLTASINVPDSSRVGDQIALMSSVHLVVVVQPADMMATRKIRSGRHEDHLMREAQIQLFTPSPEVLSEMD